MRRKVQKIRRQFSSMFDTLSFTGVSESQKCHKQTQVTNLLVDNALIIRFMRKPTLGARVKSITYNCIRAYFNHQ